MKTLHKILCVLALTLAIASVCWMVDAFSEGDAKLMCSLAVAFVLSWGGFVHFLGRMRE